ncbi:hypothetical protein GOBAR_AA19275 [Gossypium barbadense]|uniref:Uncharacterized protein n=1 Tax=Gossypium barbadense TaxID=3634 RepID=A0A2P5XDH7_GOSBA|nr:hypothetical protein GOBAR_AA19275 [Gossypium barbadense]
MLDDDDLGTMMKIWWSTGSENPQPVELFAESADLEPVENDNIDDEGLEEVEDVHSPSFSNLSHGIFLRNEPRGDMLKVYPDAAHASEFLEYADIVPTYRLASNSQLEELFIRQQLKNKAGCVFAIKQYNIKLLIDYQVAKSTLTLYNSYVGYELEARRFKHKLARLETEIAGSKPSLRQWLGRMELR